MHTILLITILYLSTTLGNPVFPKEDCRLEETIRCQGEEEKERQFFSSISGDSLCLDESENSTRFECDIYLPPDETTAFNYRLWAKPVATKQSLRVWIHDETPKWEIKLDQEGIIPGHWNYISLNVNYSELINNDNDTIVTRNIIVSSDSHKIEFDFQVKDSFQQDWQSWSYSTIYFYFYGNWEFSRTDPHPINTTDNVSHSKKQENVTYFIVLTVGIATMIVGFIAGGIGSIKFQKTRKLREEMAVKYQKTAKRPISDGCYENKKIEPKVEYEEGEYAEYSDKLSKTPYRTIEEEAKALNKSVIEVHFGL